MSPDLQALFARLRARLRGALVWDALASLGVVVGAAFWLGMALDWFFEPSPLIRKGVLAVCSVTMLVWLVRGLLLPLLRSLPNRELAMLVEQRQPAFADSLVTAVDLGGRSGTATVAVDPQLAAATQQHAIGVLQRYGDPELVNTDGSRRKTAMSAAFLVALLALTIVRYETVATYMSRLALSAEPWPRSVRLVLDGFSRGDDGVWRKKIAKGDSLDLSVRADLTGDFIDPRQLWLRYKLPGGFMTKKGFARVGQPTAGRDAHQLYETSLDDIRADVRMQIYGGDGRLGPILVQVSPRPTVTAARLCVVPPGYRGQGPRYVSASALAPLEQGVALSIDYSASKPIAQVKAAWRGGNSVEPLLTLQPGQRTFSIALPALLSGGVLETELVDTEGIRSAEPYAIPISLEPDDPPEVDFKLVGVSTLVTPDAKIEFALEASDDHAVASAWVGLQVDDGPTERIDLKDPTERVARFATTSVLDLLTRRFSAGRDAGRLEPGQQVSLLAHADDFYDLTTSDRTSSSQHYLLEVVTVNQLLARIEEREINLRRTFEQVLDEMRTVQRAIIPTDLSAFDDATTPTPTDEASRQSELRRARLRDSAMKVGVETAAVGEAFQAIHLELLQNRVPNEDLIQRIEGKIARPLAKLHGEQLTQLQQAVGQASGSPQTETRVDVRLLANSIVEQMESILEQMKSLETYNEVLAVLRQVIDDQQRVLRATERTRRSQLRQLLLD